MIDGNSSRVALLFQDSDAGARRCQDRRSRARMPATSVAESERTRRARRFDRSNTGDPVGFRRTEA